MPGKNNLVLILFSLIFLAALPIFAQEFSPPVSPISVGKQKFPTGINPQQKRELLQQRLQSITDTRKAALVLNINDKIADINTRSTQQMTDVLNQMSDILSLHVDVKIPAQTQDSPVNNDKIRYSYRILFVLNHRQTKILILIKIILFSHP